MFKGPSHALSWAANVISKVIIHSPSINYKYNSPSRSETSGVHIHYHNDLTFGLSDKERHIQAQKIVQYVRELDDLSREYLMGKYFLDNDIVSIKSHISRKMDDSRDISAVIYSYLGRKVTHRSMRESLSCGNDRVSYYQDRVYKLMDKIHTKAINGILDRLLDAQLVETSKYF